MKKLTVFTLVLLLCIPVLTLATDGSIRNERNQLIGVIRSDGTVRNASTTIGMIKADGTIRNMSTTTGKIAADGTIRNSTNQILGKVESDGTVRNERNQILGKIENNGTVKNGRNQNMGSAPGLKKEWVAVFFFFTFFD
ncbi:hypothetical protein MASR1M90_07070 [Desulfovibrionales bacterium]